MKLVCKNQTKHPSDNRGDLHDYKGFKSIRKFLTFSTYPTSLGISLSQEKDSLVQELTVELRFWIQILDTSLTCHRSSSFKVCMLSFLSSLVPLNVIGHQEFSSKRDYL
ncbi:unnamed protein product [Caretta caretta]